MIRSFTSGGFTLSFENGLTISVMFGSINYGSNRHKESADMRTIHGHKGMEALTAEVAIWDEAGRWYTFKIQERETLGYVSAEGVADWIAAVKEATSLADIKEPQTEY